MEGPASEHASPEVLVKAPTANELSGYRPSTNKEDAVQKFIILISDNAQSRVWMSQDLSVYSNFQYVYAIFPTSVASFWGQGGRGIIESKSLSMIFTILTHCLNKTAINNYSAREKRSMVLSRRDVERDAPHGTSR